jgi:urease accessory protein
VFELLHLCDSMFPIGGFSHSDGLEAATASGAVKTAADLRAWMDACLDETLAHCDGPAMWLAWHGFTAGRWEDLAALDAEVHALRPSSTGRAAGRAMGTRLVKTWHQMRPHPGLAAMLDRDDASFTLPVGFGAVGAAAGIDARAALDGFVYTRLAATVSAAMRLMAIGQHEAHALLAVTLARAPGVVEAVIQSGRAPSAFAPALDLAAMSQQYVHSRLFRS